jgi:hypothetical protein
VVFGTASVSLFVELKRHSTLNPINEQHLVNALRAAEQSGDALSIESALGGLSLYYIMQERYAEALPYWHRQASLVKQTTSAESRELGVFLYNMAAMCLVPAGLLTEARVTLLRAKEIYLHHLKPEDDGIRQIDRLLHELPV